jgi:alpha-galactosidase
MKRISISLSIIAAVQAVNNGLGRTPAMGWNTWNKYGCNIDADIIKNNTDMIV